MEALIESYLAGDAASQQTSLDKQKVVFIRIPKSASMSIVQCLTNADLDIVVGGHNESLELCQGDYVKMSSYHRLCSSNTSNTIDTSTLSSISAATKVALGFSEFDSAFKFCVVRNPYDRAVSSWRYIYNESGPSFSEFCELLSERGLHSTQWNWHERVHICEQLPHIMDPSSEMVLVDHVGRFEDLDATIRLLAKRTGVDSLQLPHINAQQRSSYQYYYTDHLQSLIYNVYKRDIEYFGYSYTEEAKTTANNL